MKKAYNKESIWRTGNGRGDSGLAARKCLHAKDTGCKEIFILPGHLLGSGPGQHVPIIPTCVLTPQFCN